MTNTTTITIYLDDDSAAEAELVFYAPDEFEPIEETLNGHVLTASERLHAQDRAIEAIADWYQARAELAADAKEGR